jgi:GTP-binding protein HflX
MPQIAVFNKIDRSGETAHAEVDAAGRVDRLWLSAHTGEGVVLLLEALHTQLGSDLHHCVLTLPPHAGKARARLFEAGAVLAQRQLEDGRIEIEVSLRRRELERICRDAGIEMPAECAPCAPGERFLQFSGPAAVRAAG